MAGTRIRDWFIEAKEAGATNLIIVCDTFDWEDYPVQVMPGEDIEEVMKGYNYDKNMQRIMEVYCMKRSMKNQIAEYRAWHTGKR
jgi:hypothetical protein